MKLAMQYMDSPVGRLRLIANEKALVAVLWENEQPKRIQLAELVVERSIRFCFRYASSLKNTLRETGSDLTYR